MILSFTLVFVALVILLLLLYLEGGHNSSVDRLEDWRDALVLSTLTPSEI